MTIPYSNLPIGRLELPNQIHLRDSLGEKGIGGIKCFSATKCALDGEESVVTRSSHHPRPQNKLTSEPYSLWECYYQNCGLYQNCEGFQHMFVLVLLLLTVFTLSEI